MDEHAFPSVNQDADLWVVGDLVNEGVGEVGWVCIQDPDPVQALQLAQVAEELRKPVAILGIHPILVCIL